MKITVQKSGRVFEKRAVPRYVIEPALREALDDAQEILRKNTPRDTGRAQEGWKVDRSLRFVSNDVPYIKYLDSGTSRMKAFNITSKSIPGIRIKFRTAIERNIKGLSA